VRALAIYGERPAEIVWVLMDVTMPEMDGHAALLALRKINPSVVVLMSSGWAEEELVARFADHPPAGFLSKPFAIPELVATLTRLGLIDRG
jgi:two-component system cell cycle sensor histidine kinase/response regulator CckA